MTARQTIIVIITAFVAVGVTGVVREAAGWPLAVVTLVAISLAGGLIGRIGNKRELDRHRSRAN